MYVISADNLLDSFLQGTTIWVVIGSWLCSGIQIATQSLTTNRFGRRHRMHEISCGNAISTPGDDFARTQCRSRCIKIFESSKWIIWTPIKSQCTRSKKWKRCDGRHQLRFYVRQCDFNRQMFFRHTMPFQFRFIQGLFVKDQGNRAGFRSLCNKWGWEYSRDRAF